MTSLSQEAVKSKDPINHYVMSWRVGERPTPKQIEVAVDIFMNELDLKEHQAIYGMHANTDNMHLHLVVNRVHPETLKCVKINGGFDIEAAHQAIAKIEHEQGWQREQNGRYQVLENGEVERKKIDSEKARQPGQQPRDIELRTGEKSAERIAIEDGAPIIKQAKTWEQLHRELAEKKMRYERVGSGAMVFVGDVAIKASSVDRTASFSQIQKRLGEYQPAKEIHLNAYYHHTEKPDLAEAQSSATDSLRRLSECRVAQIGKGPGTRVLQIDACTDRRDADGLRRDTTGRASLNRIEPLKPEIPGWKDYATGRGKHYAQENAAKLAQDKQQEKEQKELQEQQKTRRDVFLRYKNV